MNPTIIIESESNDLLAPPRELLCSVWPVLTNGDGVTIGEPIFSNHMVLVGATEYDEHRSILTLPAAGSYLVDIGFPNGQSQRTTISISPNQNYHLILESTRKVVPPPVKKEHARSWIPKVVSAAAKNSSKKKNEIEISIISQNKKTSLLDTYGFLNSLTKPSQPAETIFEHSSGNEASHEVQLNPSEHTHPRSPTLNIERKWIVMRCTGKSQTLIAYPHEWRCLNQVPFKLLINRKAKDKHDYCKWSASLTLMDSVYGSMVEYLTRRDLFSSRLISESAQGKAASALYKKSGNPFAAAAAAYIIALDGSDDSQHHIWMRNLSSRYTWLPDGAIALGWKTLYEGQNDQYAWSTARELFSLACSRGLPYFTIGLHILVDALMLLSQVDPDDRDVLEMLAFAKAADVACIRTEPFTTLQIPKYLGLPIKQI